MANTFGVDAGDLDQPTAGSRVEGASSPLGSPSSLRPGVVFISHEKTDVGLAREIRSHLEAGGLSCWMAPDDIRGSTPWPHQVEQAIESCDVMLVVVSAHATGSQHVSREVDLAVEKSCPLLPVRVEEVAPTGTLNYLLRLAQWIDLFPGSISDHAASLQAMVGSMLEERGIAPPTTSSEKGGWRWRRVPRQVLFGVAAFALLAIGIGIGAILGGGDETPIDTVTEVPTGEDLLIVEAPGDSGGDEQPVTEVPDTQAPAPAGKGTIDIVSIASGGELGDNHSTNATISADGRWVAFDSLASNLVEGDTNALRDVFVHELDTRETTRISQVSFGDRVEEADGDSHHPQISADGRYVVFASSAMNLDPDYTDQPPADSIYVHDRETGRNRIISFRPEGNEHWGSSYHPDISEDGTLVVYGHGQFPREGTRGTGSYEAFVHDTLTGVTTLLAEFDTAQDGVQVTPPQVTADGSLAVAAGHMGGVFVYERESGSIREISALLGVQRVVPLRGGTRFAVLSGQDPLVLNDLNGMPDVYSFDVESEEFTLLMESGPAWGGELSASDDGRYISLVKNDFVGVIDTTDGSVAELSTSIGLNRLELGPGGPVATFSSTKADLVPGDNNGRMDVFVIQFQE